MRHDEPKSSKPGVKGRTLIMAVLCAAPFIASVAFYPFLPDVVVTHYWIVTPDAWSPKAWKLVVPGAFCTGANALMWLILDLVKRGVLPEKPGRSIKAAEAATIGAVVLVDLASVILLAANL